MKPGLASDVPARTPFDSSAGLGVQVAGAVEAVSAERRRQHEKWGEQNHDMMTWLAILHEETGELAEACLHEKFGGPAAENVMLEAVQVAAVALQIVEFLQRGMGAGGCTPNENKMSYRRSAAHRLRAKAVRARRRSSRCDARSRLAPSQG